MKSCNMGGQAVIEGVMMRYKSNVAVSVRKPDGDIQVGCMKYAAATSKHPALKWPIVRGVVSFVDSMVLGIKTLMYSASIFEEEAPENKDDKKEAKVNAEAMKSKSSSKGESALMAGTVVFSLGISVVLFVLLPYFVSSLITKFTDSTVLLAVVEGILKVGIFVGYLAAISLMPDIKRTFMYHGAEHKCINCIESGKELTVDNVMVSSKEHRRCGTSFLFFVVLISIIFCMFIRVKTWWLRLVIRLLIIPLVAGVSYEFIQWAGNSDSKLATIFSRPGMWMQGLTTKEPLRDMVEVAIASVEHVFDWRKYLEDMKNASGDDDKKCRSSRYSCGPDPYEVELEVNIKD
ncbi:MAG: DUF1385 domain-containing protein [Parasporobacterium sp.]|nr:DUF1385 domain-containing protein [Parasporobacterium sp.]